MSDSHEAIRRPRHLLPAIIGAQFAGTSLWFAGNAVMGDLQRDLALSPTSVGPMTSSVQLGFIVGTLIVAGLGVADRFSPRAIFAMSAFLGAACNLCITVVPGGFVPILVLRFATGVTLAGIYPVGMKIASGWYRGELGAALGWLVGALVLGTALPHGVRALGGELPWQGVLATVSAVAAGGGVLLYVLVPDGPFLARGATFHPRMLLELFAEPRLRAAALGYFGHMWELYALWATVPLLLAASGVTGVAASTWSFAVIGVGFFGCGLGGLLSLERGSAFVARGMLALSGLCCLAAPLLAGAPKPLALAGLVLWGFAVVGDSPQFSTLVANNAPTERVGTALTLVNSIGFAITIPAIELLTRVASVWPPHLAALLLAPGPVMGLWAMRRVDR